ncbi:MAG: hypothetical protein KJZ64_10220 [Sphingomonadaceae bacterium]|nr:hypothetical protein [Sphingomonadaceae bacterium]
MDDVTDPGVRRRIPKLTDRWIIIGVICAVNLLIHFGPPMLQFIAAMTPIVLVMVVTRGKSDSPEIVIGLSIAVMVLIVVIPLIFVAINLIKRDRDSASGWIIVSIITTGFVLTMMHCLYLFFDMFGAFD